MAAANSSKLVIYAALGGNLLIAFTKLVAAIWTGSSAMLSESVHSLVDTGNQGLMLYGIYRADQPPDRLHPLGYGRELYFWSFIVALLIFSLGAGISLYEGVAHIREPAVVTNPSVNYAVLGVSFPFEGVTWWLAWREFARQRGDIGIIDAVTRSRDPTSFLVLFEDSAALIGIVIALAGTLSAEILSIPELDGVASIGIGLVLAATAVFLARESKSLLIGEPAREFVVRSIDAMVRGHAGVSGVGRLITVHLAPEQIVVSMDVDFADDLRASEVETIVGDLDRQLKEKHSDVIALFVNPRAARHSRSMTRAP
jgi:cation diffusion facilitator family transporter